MNITYIIGNGFDVNLGLKTKYSDFYDYYLGIETTNEDIEKLKEDISKNVTFWSDLERRLGEYTEKVSNVDTMIDLFDDIARELQQYIAEQAATIPETNDKIVSSLLKDFTEPEQYFARIDRESIKTFNHKFGGEANISIITLNYTPTIEKLLDYNGSKSIKIKDAHFNGSIPILKNIYHVHHTIEDSINDIILLGVNDEMQIKNEKFRNSQRLREYMIKPETNIMLKTGIDRDCINIISNTNLFVFFGVSIGETDKKWWDLIGNQVSNSDNCRIMIFDYRPQVELNLRESGENERKVKEKFSSQTTIPKERLGTLNGRIYVSINSQMFSDVKQYV